MTQPTPREEMTAFDQLPVELRQALARAGDQFSASFIFHALMSKRATCAELIDLIAEQDRSKPC